MKVHSSRFFGAAFQRRRSRILSPASGRTSLQFLAKKRWLASKTLLRL
jgi:hypothetical protein